MKRETRDRKRKMGRKYETKRNEEKKKINRSREKENRGKRK